jgi:tyrosine-protein phosphatase SIW14
MITQSKQTNRQSLFGKSQDSHSRYTGIVLIITVSLICIFASCATLIPDQNTSQPNTSNVTGYEDPNDNIHGQTVRPVSLEANDSNPSVDIQNKPAIKLNLPGLPNFYKVSDNLYRGAQPTAEGMRQLKKLGIKTVINLRSMHSDRDEIGNTKLTYKHIPMTAFNPKTSDVIRFLQIISDSNCAPVFVHCQHGSDRTGMMCAIYRIAVQGWSKDQAIKEMTKGGFGFHSIFKNLVKYIRRLDINKLKQSSGLNEYAELKTS